MRAGEADGQCQGWGRASVLLFAPNGPFFTFISQPRGGGGEGSGGAAGAISG